jgi:transposase
LTCQQEGRRAWKRYQTVVRARQGDTAEHIARVLNCGANTIGTWVARDNAGGAAALDER